MMKTFKLFVPIPSEQTTRLSNLSSAWERPSYSVFQLAHAAVTYIANIHRCLPKQGLSRLCNGHGGLESSKVCHFVIWQGITSFGELATPPAFKRLVVLKYMLQYQTSLYPWSWCDVSARAMPALVDQDMLFLNATSHHMLGQGHSSGLINACV